MIGRLVISLKKMAYGIEGIAEFIEVVTEMKDKGGRKDEGTDSKNCN